MTTQDHNHSNKDEDEKCPKKLLEVINEWCKCYEDSDDWDKVEWKNQWTKEREELYLREIYGIQLSHKSKNCEPKIKYINIKITYDYDSLRNEE